MFGDDLIRDVESHERSVGDSLMGTDRFYNLKRITLFLFNRLLNSSQKRTLSIRPKKIIVIQLNQLGDTLVFSPAIRAIRKSFPDAQFDVLANQITAQIYQYCPYINNIWIFPLKLICVDLMRLMLKIRRQSYDVAVLDVAQIAFHYGLIAFLTGAKDRVGFDWDGRGCFHTVCVPWSDKHIIEMNLDVIKAMKATPDSPATEFWIDEKSTLEAKCILKQHGIALDDSFVCINVSSKSPAKFWPSDRWAKLTDEINSRYNVKIVFTGIPSDFALAKLTMDRMKNCIINLIGKTNIHQFAALLEMSSLLITVDSGPMHIATGLGTNVVALFSCRNYPYEWIPLTKNSIVVRSDVPCTGCRLSICPIPYHPCMNKITVEDVLKAVDKFLSKNEGRC